MTKTTTLKLALLSTLAFGGCGNDPYAGDSTITDTSTVTTTVTQLTTTTTTTTTTSTSTVGPDAGVGGPDAPADTSNLATYYISVAPVRDLDLVFMIDNSPSMAPKQKKMNDNFPRLIAALKDPADGTLPNLRVAIIDSDLGTAGAYSSGSCGPKTLTDGTMSSYGDLGRFQMINASTCGVTSADAMWIEYSKGMPVNYKGDINTVFACLAGGLSTLGCGEEHPLQAFEFALVAKGVGNEAQQAMLRPNAYLGLVFLSDEDDCSAATNDGMFGDMSALHGESASLRCATRGHACNGKNLSDTDPPNYPTDGAFQTSFTNCVARMGDECANQTDGFPQGTDTSVPTTCNPLKSVRNLAKEIKSLKRNPDQQIFVAGIFGWPLSEADMASATYKIDMIPNPNTADVSHPQIYDYWPVCYDPTVPPPKDGSFDANAFGNSATGGLRMSAFIDEFGANGLKFSICQTDFSSSMKGIGDALAKKMQNLCIGDKLLDTDLTAPGLQPDCTAHYLVPTSDPKNPNTVTLVEQAALPQCPTGSINGSVSVDCWQLVNDTTMCPSNGQKVQALRTAQEIAAGSLTAGTLLLVQCQLCSASDTTAGCNY